MGKTPKDLNLQKRELGSDVQKVPAPNVTRKTTQPPQRREGVPEIFSPEIFRRGVYPSVVSGPEGGGSPVDPSLLSG